MVGAIALMSDGMGRMIRGTRYGGGSGGGGGRGRGRGGNPLGLIVLGLWLLTLVVAPIVSRILAMAVSRKREYLADATAAQFTRNPMALASALEKLDAAAAPTRAITRGAAHLCIVDPAPGLLSSREGFLADFLASHPPIRQRIIRLEGMGYQQAKRVGEPLSGQSSALPPA
jgi:heat shock protein HtpX